MKCRPGPGWRLSHLEHADHLGRRTDLLDVAEGLLLDRREATGDVSLSRLRALGGLGLLIGG